MPWRYARLRGNRVLVRVRADGSPEGEGGRVEIRYKKDDPRAYRAAIVNLELEAGEPLGDDDVVPGAPVGDKKEASKGGKAGGKGSKPTAAAPVVEGTAWIAYTDGACSGNPGPAGAGFVVLSPAGRSVEGYEYLGTATNNIAELTGILRALEVVPRDAGRLVVFTDSSYAIGVLSKGWKAKTNQALIETIRKVLKERADTELRYVPGHAGVPLNERADELARGAILERGSHFPIWS